jgi:hypothetical protein
MSRPFAKYFARPTFAQINEPQAAGDYISKKKLNYLFPNVTNGNKNIGSHTNYINIIKQKNNCNNYVDNFDTQQLYSNLYDTLDLSGGVLVISNLEENTFPVSFDKDSIIPPFLKYNIDASGNLFGNTLCGINNYKQYLRYLR